MEYGESDMDLTNLLVSGAPGSGKTHLHHYIYGTSPPETRISTACIESAHRGLIMEFGSSEEVIIKGVNDIRPLIASTVQTLQGSKGKDSKSKDEDSKVEDSKIEDSKVEQSKVEDSKVEDSKVEDSKVEDSRDENIRDEDSRDEDSVLEELQTANSSNEGASPGNLSASTHLDKNEILDWLKIHKSRLQLKGHWVHLVDSGGQQAFLEIIPCLIRNIGLLVLVFKLSEELSAQTEVQYWDPNGGHYLGKFNISNEELLAYTAQLSQYHRSQIDLPFVENLTATNPRIVVVGTFKDQEDNCNQSRQEKSDRLKELLAPFEDQLIYPSQNENSIIFAVNALLAGKGDEEEERVANELRKVIKSAPKYKVKMPLQYLFLEVELSRNAVVTKSYSWQVAQELHFKSMEDLEYCLSFLHQVNLIFYYPESLPNTIITQPDAIISIITQIFQHHLRLRESKLAREFEVADEVFLNQAIFPVELLQQFEIKYNTTILPHKDMMKLLQHRLIVAPVSMDSTTTHYFMPSLLDEIPPIVLRYDFSPKSHLNSPLTISFPRSLASKGASPNDPKSHFSSPSPRPWAPNGVFSALMIKMLQYEGKACFQLTAAEQCSKHKLVKNIVYLTVKVNNDIGSITVVNLMEYFEIYIHNLSHQYLPLIEDVLDENLLAVYATLSYSVSHKFGVLCKCSEMPRHAAFLSDDNHYLICSMTNQSYEQDNIVEKASHLIGKVYFIHIY